MHILHTHSSSRFNDRKLPLDMIILHYTDLPGIQDAFKELCGPAAQNSAHYLVDEDGAVYGLVDEKYRAWHAGVSFWNGVTDTNSRSVGIEIVNPGHSWGYRPFPDAQIGGVCELCLDIMKRHNIPAANVLAHSDVAPTRKKDPGELFPWKQLAEKGIGLWTDEFAPAGKSPAEMLAAIGYDITDEDAALTAFQRHFYPEALTRGALRTNERLAAAAALFARKDNL